MPTLHKQTTQNSKAVNTAAASAGSASLESAAPPTGDGGASKIDSFIRGRLDGDDRAEAAEASGSESKPASAPHRGNSNKGRALTVEDAVCLVRSHHEARAFLLRRKL